MEPNQCADSAADTAEYLRKGQGEVLKVRFGNTYEARVIAEWKLSNMGEGWHISRVDAVGSPHLAFLGRVPWKEAERVALEFVALLEGERRAKLQHIEASGRVNSLAAEIRGRSEAQQSDGYRSTGPSSGDRQTQ